MWRQQLQGDSSDPKDSILVKLRKLLPSQCICKNSKKGHKQWCIREMSVQSSWGTQGSLHSHTVFHELGCGTGHTANNVSIWTKYYSLNKKWRKMIDIFIVMDVIQRINREWLFIVFHKIRHRKHPELFCVCPEFLEALVEIEYRKDRLRNNSPFCALDLLTGNGNCWKHMKSHFSLCYKWPNYQPGNLSVIFTQAEEKQCSKKKTVIFIL